MLSAFKTLLRRGQKYQHVAHFESVLGTSLELQLSATSRAVAARAEAALLAEIDRLEAVFSRFRPDSELNRWQATLGRDVAVSADLGWLLEQSLIWQRSSSGAFHPGVDALSALWQGAARAGHPPSDERIAQILETLRQPPYRVQNGTARRLSAAPLNFNAFAKGRIVDCALSAARRVGGVSRVLVNIGGDLRHSGEGGAVVEIADPTRKVDNAAPIARVQIQNQAVATSGRAHRGVMIGSDWYSHVIDPRNGQPARQVVSASGIAPDSATADVLATAFSVLQPWESLELADRLEGVGCLIVTEANEVVFNHFWRQHTVD